MIAHLDTFKARESFQTYNTASDRDLIARCLCRDSEAWAELVDRYGRLVYSIARRFGLSDSDAEDVFQHTFLSLYRHLTSIRDRTKLSSWLITTARRESFRVAKEQQSSLSGVEAMLDNDVTNDRAERDRLERQSIVRLALRQLDRRDRDLLTALFLNTGSPNYEQVAEDLGMKTGSIGPTRARALERLRSILITMGFEEAEIVAKD